ncbi:MAG: LPS export ABC transporter permease LptG [Burkholderiaceae bacterium]|nr:LPS export ABC transporter permease LptG [Burkholderiales bacterium]TAL72687.1 MAG: LPS export ABC transporter permease LptG [Burkholderiaceae bacterium]TBR74963.1 MAG: LPS export ABC transporter permease LptG [Burkholderiaceae bacterium]
MKTVRRMIHTDVLRSVGFVTLAFLALFFFFDFVDELRSVNQGAAGGYPLKYAVLVVLLESPSRLYDLLPITVLIGTIFVMARMAQSSEFTILRTSGLGPWRALQTLLGLGLMFVLLTFAVGDYLAPAADQAGQLLRSHFLGQAAAGHTGAWLKERHGGDSYAVNVGALLPDGSMRGLRIVEFGPQGRMVSVMQAAQGSFDKDGSWLLKDVSSTDFAAQLDTAGSTQTQRVTRTVEPALRWPSTITEEMVSVALLQPDRMPTVDLFQYIRHLEANGQSSQRYEIQFWKKVFYPLSCLVMVVLALPFAYLHFRAGGMSTYVFIGVMTGISFFLLNNLFSHFGNLQNWRPWLAAAAPGLIYSVLSLGAFGWLVLRR